jgi:hypothetical protein
MRFAHFAASMHGTVTRDSTDLANTPKAGRFPYGLKLVVSEPVEPS